MTSRAAPATEQRVTSEPLWRWTATHARCVDRDADFRRAVVDWLDEHQLDPWSCVDIAVTGNQLSGLRLEALVHDRDDDGRPTGRWRPVAVPLLRMPPEPPIGWHDDDTDRPVPR